MPQTLNPIKPRTSKTTPLPVVHTLPATQGNRPLDTEGLNSGQGVGALGRRKLQFYG